MSEEAWFMRQKETYKRYDKFLKEKGIDHEENQSHYAMGFRVWLAAKPTWQLIETAPKCEEDVEEWVTGPEILTCTKRGHPSVRYWGPGEDDNYAWQPRIRGVFPSFWMPLPAKPTPKEGS